VRGDRLVAILLLLQRKDRVTAREVAEELEISERTARRDLDALAVAGVPVYSERGRHGGWRLLGGGRTDLSGLTAPEARALFLVAGTTSSLTPEVKAALRKLVRALPEPMRAEAESASRAVVVDPSGWGHTPRADGEADHLSELQAATVTGVQVRLAYRDRTGRDTVRTVHPLGLARKARTWYLLAATDDGLRTFRVTRVTSVEPTGDPVVRPPGFDLAEAWRQTVDRVEELRSPAELRCLVTHDYLEVLRWMFGRQLTIGDAADDGRVHVTVAGHRLEVLASQVAGFGRDVEVLGPEPARRHLARLGTQLQRVYATEASASPDADADPVPLRPRPPSRS
jgi:predicted DNA-binding transcriptional regulator YafY